MTYGLLTVRRSSTGTLKTPFFPAGASKCRCRRIIYYTCAYGNTTTGGALEPPPNPSKGAPVPYIRSAHVQYVGTYSLPGFTYYHRLCQGGCTRVHSAPARVRYYPHLPSRRGYTGLPSWSIWASSTLIVSMCNMIYTVLQAIVKIIPHLDNKKVTLLDWNSGSKSAIPDYRNWDVLKNRCAHTLSAYF